MSSLNSVFKYPKIRNITQTLQEKDIKMIKRIIILKCSLPTISKLDNPL